MKSISAIVFIFTVIAVYWLSALFQPIPTDAWVWCLMIAGALFVETLDYILIPECLQLRGMHFCTFAMLGILMN